MSTLDKYKVLHGLPEVGQKITFIRPTPSWFTNVERDCELLVPGDEYTVRKTELNSSSTYVWLEEFSDILDVGRDQPFFNIASFEWVKPELDFNDLIGMNARDLTRLNYSYGWGIKLKDSVVCEGSPMLHIDYDNHDRITSLTLIKTEV